MKRNIIAALALTAALAYAADDKPIEWHHGIVADQKLNSVATGTSTDVYRGVFTGGIHSTTQQKVVQTNDIWVEADGYRWRWTEAGERGDTYRIERLVLPVGGAFDFYFDMNRMRYVVLDARGKKHWFKALSQEVIKPAAEAPAQPEAGKQ